MPRPSRLGRILLSALAALTLVSTASPASADETQSPSAEVSDATVLAAKAYPASS
ncbi:MAG: hypothetical protein R2731_09240 [Nocardioides sp.]